METLPPKCAPTDGCAETSDASPRAVRASSLRRALRLEYLTVGWNVVEGIIAVTAAALAGSVALLGFGIDSFIECASAFVLIWRLRAEHTGSRSESEIDALEHRTRKLVACTLLLLAGYVTFDALTALAREERPEFSPVGAILLVVSVAVMWLLAREKKRVARELGSEAMEADAFQTTACWWISLTALLGIGLNGLVGWWWADPAAALAIAALIAREARESWKGRACC
jgi:divalent metal cation (Fe/Co/Zn/Cd) transporter